MRSGKRNNSFLHAVALALLLISAATSFAQQNKRETPINLFLRQLIDSPPDGVSDAHLMVSGDLDEIRQQTSALGGHYKYTFRNYASILIPLDQVDALASCSCVDRIAVASGFGQALNDKQLINNKVWQVHSGLSPLPQAYKGNGVIMGVIDSGLELNHADFMNSDSTTRVIELWDQRLSFDIQRTPFYGYGQVWDSAEINAGICPHDDWGSFGHGTNVAGIAAGNGLATGNFRGTAPETELVIVATNFGAINWTVTVAEAVDYIFRVADSLGRPAVVNASIGTYLGSHDARDLGAQMIDSLLGSEPGRVMVCAAGNAGDEDPFHLGYPITSDTSWTWFEDGPNSPYGVDTLIWEFWADTADFNNVMFSVGVEDVGSGFLFQGQIPFDNVLNRLNMVVSEDIFDNGNNFQATVQTWVGESEGRYQFQVFVEGNGNPDHRYRFYTTGSGRFDCWSDNWLNTAHMVGTNLPPSPVLPDIIHYKAPDIDQSIVSSWACSDRVLTVANYINRTSYMAYDNNLRTYPNLTEGEIADDSSFGPARTGVQKPDLASPGGATLAATESSVRLQYMANPQLQQNLAQDGWHNVNGGTSMASPGVAGISALFLEKCPQATFQDVKDALIAVGREDGFTGSLPNNRWGHGKADGFETLLTSNFSTNLQAPTTSICIGDTVTITINESFDSYLWSTGDTSSSIDVEVSGLYFVELTNELGCKGMSDTLSFIAHPKPNKPGINNLGPLTFCEGETVELSVDGVFGSYHWSNNAFTESIEVGQSGNYTVTVSNIHGCTQFSDPVTVDVLPAPSIPVLQYLDGTISSTSDPNWTYQWYYGDSLIQGATGFEHIPDASGQYRVLVTDANGCSAWSDVFDHLPLGVSNAGAVEGEWSLYPNPTNGAVWLRYSGAETGGLTYQVFDLPGRAVDVGNVASNGSGEYLLNFKMPSAGVYFLKVQWGHNTEVLRFVSN